MSRNPNTNRAKRRLKRRMKARARKILALAVKEAEEILERAAKSV